MSNKLNDISDEKGFIPILFLGVVVAVVTLVSAANITTTNEYPPSLASQNVLGEDEEVKNVEEQSKEADKKAEEQHKDLQKSEHEGEKKQEEQPKESAKKTVERQKELEKKALEQRKGSTKSGNSGKPNLVKNKIETPSPNGIKSKSEIEDEKNETEADNNIDTEDEESETEIETADGKKIKTKIEKNGRVKIEIEHGPLKLKYVMKNGQLKLKAENEQGQEVELDDNELEEVENEIEGELEEDGIKIATGSGKPVLAKNNIAAFTDFPLSIDVGTNQLIVTTPAGQKIVTILPDQAVQNLLATNKITKIEQTSDPSLTNELGTLNGVVKLEIRNEEMVYKIKGTKSHNLLGFIPVDRSSTAFVSAQTGDVIAQEQSLLTNLIDLISF